MRLLLFLWLLLLIPAGCPAQPNVLYGERRLDRSTSAVFFDKDGNIYPDYFIPDSSLSHSDASLKTWYKAHPADFATICNSYHCGFDKYTVINLLVLNDSITASVKRSIEAKRTKAASVTFLVHGYRKSFKALNGDSPAPQDYGTLENAINNFSNSPLLFVEVYWDGMYDCCFSKNTRRNKELFKLFETARENAGKVGIGLRKLITGLSFDTINIVTHSLGAEVACSALFDTSKDRSATPANKTLNLCLIAPAISGVERFQAYYARNAAIDYRTKDNYRLCIIYNSNDFVLKKKIGIFGPGPYKYGNTCLGCNYDNAAADLQLYFGSSYPHSTVQLIDLSATVGCHHVICYSAGDNLKGMVEFMRR